MGIALLLSLAVLESSAQGIVNANSLSSGDPGSSNGEVYIYVQDDSVNGGVPVKIGTPAAALFGTGLGPGAVFMAMYVATAGTPIQTLESSIPVWTGYNSKSTFSTQQGSVAPSSGFILPTQPGFDGYTPLEFVFYGSGESTLGLFDGWSSVGTTIPLTALDASNADLPTHVWGATADSAGITSMILTLDSGSTGVFDPVPEPATIALGGLGAAALLMVRRRK